jgi:hypothetical protein
MVVVYGHGDRVIRHINDEIVRISFSHWIRKCYPESQARYAPSSKAYPYKGDIALLATPTPNCGHRLCTHQDASNATGGDTRKLHVRHRRDAGIAPAPTTRKTVHNQRNPAALTAAAATRRGAVGTALSTRRRAKRPAGSGSP